MNTVIQFSLCARSGLPSTSQRWVVFTFFQRVDYYGMEVPQGCWWDVIAAVVRVFGPRSNRLTGSSLQTFSLGSSHGFNS